MTPGPARASLPSAPSPALSDLPAGLSAGTGNLTKMGRAVAASTPRRKVVMVMSLRAIWTQRHFLPKSSMVSYKQAAKWDAADAPKASASLRDADVVIVRDAHHLPPATDLALLRLHATGKRVVYEGLTNTTRHDTATAAAFAKLLNEQASLPSPSTPASLP